MHCTNMQIPQERSLFCLYVFNYFSSVGAKRKACDSRFLWCVGTNYFMTESNLPAFWPQKSDTVYTSSCGRLLTYFLYSSSLLPQEVFLLISGKHM